MNPHSARFTSGSSFTNYEGERNIIEIIAAILYLRQSRWHVLAAH